MDNALTTKDKAIVAALNAALASADPFGVWLAGQPDDAIVGSAQEHGVCPIATWIRRELAPNASTIRVYSNRVTVALPDSGTAGVLFYDRGAGFADELAAFVCLVDQPEVRGVEPLTDDTIIALRESDPQGEQLDAAMAANRHVTAKLARDVLERARADPHLGISDEVDTDDEDEDEDEDFDDDFDDEEDDFDEDDTDEDEDD